MYFHFWGIKYIPQEVLKFELKIDTMGKTKIITIFLHLNKQKIKLVLRRTQQIHKFKQFDKNVSRKVSNFNVLIFKNFSVFKIKL